MCLQDQARGIDEDEEQAGCETTGEDGRALATW